MNRRKFLQYLLGGSGILAAGSLFYPLVRFLSPVKQKKETLVEVKRSEIPAGSAREIIVDNVPAIVVNRQKKGFIVLSKVCTHLGCLVNYDRVNGQLICPCHAGIYDLEGNVISGFPPGPLPQIPFRIEGDTLIIG